MDRDGSAEPPQEGYAAAIALLRRAMCPQGVVASLHTQANYRRVWARDGTVCGLAALMADDPELIEAFGRTLETLQAHQGPHGEIPSNVAADGATSYGTFVGRADAPLWYVIGCAALGARDPNLLDRHAPAMRRALWLSEAWEYNLRGLLYVPMGGTWADEYILHGYVLHVQLLKLWALRASSRVLSDGRLATQASELEHLLRANYWLDDTPGQRYHPGAYAQALAAGGPSSHWAASFHPGGYQNMFDGLANGLALLLDLGHAQEVSAYLEQLASHVGVYLTPAFFPPIGPQDAGWSELSQYYSDTFRNRPWEYHNGGLWPMVTGFVAAGLSATGRRDAAKELMRAIDTANAKGDWAFYEYLHGRSHDALGVPGMAWSAAATIMAHRAIEQSHDDLLTTLCISRPHSPPAVPNVEQ